MLFFFEKILLKKSVMLLQNVLMAKRAPSALAASIWRMKLPVPGSRYACAVLVEIIKNRDTIKTNSIGLVFLWRSIRF